jgi:hypothetical protein
MAQTEDGKEWSSKYNQEGFDYLDNCGEYEE